jgi:hypothetical protein
MTTLYDQSPQASSPRNVRCRRLPCQLSKAPDSQNISHLFPLQLLANSSLAALIHAVNLEHFFRQINANYRNLHLDAPLHFSGVKPPLLWHQDAVWGSGRPFHYNSEACRSDGYMAPLDWLFRQLSGLEQCTDIGALRIQRLLRPIICPS